MSAPMPLRRRLRAALGLVLAAVLGGVVALAGASASGLLDGDDAPQPVARPVATAVGGLDAAGIWQASSPGVVTVVARSGGADARAFTGTGFLISATGEVVTAAHVVMASTGSGDAAVVRPLDELFVRLADGDQIPATIRGADVESDVALLAIDPAAAELPAPLALGDEGELAVGSPIAVIGSPLGARQAGTLSLGAVAGLRRRIELEDSVFRAPAIQLDVAVNPGSSGSPVLDAGGAVVGLLVQSAVNGDGSSGQGIGYALPASLVARALEDIRAGGTVRWPWLGVTLREVVPGMQAGLGVAAPRGLLVNGLAVGGPAARAGLRVAGTPQPWALDGDRVRPAGDVIVAIGDRPVESLGDFWTAILPLHPGDEIVLSVVAPDGAREVRVRLGERPGTDLDDGGVAT